MQLSLRSTTSSMETSRWFVPCSVSLPSQFTLATGCLYTLLPETMNQMNPAFDLDEATIDSALLTLQSVRDRALSEKPTYSQNERMLILLLSMQNIYLCSSRRTRQTARNAICPSPTVLLRHFRTNASDTASCSDNTHTAIDSGQSHRATVSY